MQEHKVSKTGGWGGADSGEPRRDKARHMDTGRYRRHEWGRYVRNQYAACQSVSPTFLMKFHGRSKGPGVHNMSPLVQDSVAPESCLKCDKVGRNKH